MHINVYTGHTYTKLVDESGTQAKPLRKPKKPKKPKEVHQKVGKTIEKTQKKTKKTKKTKISCRPRWEHTGSTSWVCMKSLVFLFFLGFLDGFAYLLVDLLWFFGFFWVSSIVQLTYHFHHPITYICGQCIHYCTLVYISVYQYMLMCILICISVYQCISMYIGTYSCIVDILVYNNVHQCILMYMSVYQCI